MGINFTVPRAHFVSLSRKGCAVALGTFVDIELPQSSCPNYRKATGPAINYDGAFLIHDTLQKIRDIDAADFRNPTIATKQKNSRYVLAEGAVIE